MLDALAAAGVRPDGVLTFWENSIDVCARVAAALGLPGNPVEAVDAARSKVRTRELSTALGLPSPRARRVRSLDELFAAAPYVGFPAVVKPEFGASAMGCVRVDALEELPEDLLPGAQRRRRPSTTGSSGPATTCSSRSTSTASSSTSTS